MSEFSKACPFLYFTGVSNSPPDLLNSSFRYLSQNALSANTARFSKKQTKVPQKWFVLLKKGLKFSRLFRQIV